jgi:4-hydroxythreonine-4-phosphate dehydrogenase
VLPVKLDQSAICGQADPGNANYTLKTLQTAVQACLSGHFDAIVTGPVNKGIINDAGIPFTGHTEYLAGLCETEQVVMMLSVPGLKVALATTHLPINQVSQAITPELLEKTLVIIHQNLTRLFAITNPRILVCGLNPHAGESGHLGREEIDTIIPVIEKLQSKGLNISGPAPADTAFTKNSMQNADVILAMYHDQGLAVLKHMGFGKAVNTTLGLPIIRTSVDHGTALELAGTGKADISSMVAAIHSAASMIEHSKK